MEERHDVVATRVFEGTVDLVVEKTVQYLENTITDLEFQRFIEGILKEYSVYVYGTWPEYMASYVPGYLI